MARPIPTDAEFLVLEAIWDGGPSSVRAVHERLGRAIGYTGVLKLLQIMHVKGLVRRDESERAHIYAAIECRDEVASDLGIETVTVRPEIAVGGARSRPMSCSPRRSTMPWRRCATSRRRSTD